MWGTLGWAAPVAACGAGKCLSSSPAPEVTHAVNCPFQCPLLTAAPVQESELCSRCSLLLWVECRGNIFTPLLFCRAQSSSGLWHPRCPRNACPALAAPVVLQSPGRSCCS